MSQPPYQLDRLPSPAWPLHMWAPSELPDGHWQEPRRSGLCSLGSMQFAEALALLSAATPRAGAWAWRLSWAAVVSIIFSFLFAGDINLAGSWDGCVLTSHPGLDSVGSRCPSAGRRWRTPRSLWGRLWSQRISRNRCRDRPAAPLTPPTASLQTGPVNY